MDAASDPSPLRRVPSGAFRPVARRRLADEIVEQVRRLLVEEGLTEGDRLPSERDLAARVGASRAVVAQALRTLSLMGLVEIRPGSGAYVLRDPATMVRASVDLMLDLREGSLAHLCELRLWLETLGAVEAARRRDAGLDRRLADALDHLVGSEGNPSSLVAADTNFHALVVAGAGNPYLTTLYESVHTVVVTAEFERWVRTDEPPSWLGDRQGTAHDRLHRPILEAVVAGDEAAVRQALQVHHEALLEHLAILGGASPGRPGRYGAGT